jgi:hypothetical protein
MTTERLAAIVMDAARIEQEIAPALDPRLVPAGDYTCAVEIRRQAIGLKRACEKWLAVRAFRAAQTV